MTNQKKLGLSLRGGAGRCVGYIGVFKALREEDIKVDYIIGSSMGAIMAAMYAKEFSIDRMLELTNLFQLKKMFTLESIHDLTVLGDHKFEKELETAFDDMDLKDLKIPTHIQVTNLSSRKPEVFNSGPIKKIVMASCAYPFYSPAVKYNNQFYIDGDITAGYGADILRKAGSEVVIGISAGVMKSFSNHNSLTNRWMEPLNIASENYRQLDLEINPLDLRITDLGLDAGPFDFDRFPELIENGYRVAKSMMPEIKTLLKPKFSLTKFFKELIHE